MDLLKLSALLYWFAGADVATVTGVSSSESTSTTQSPEIRRSRSTFS